MSERNGAEEGLQGRKTATSSDTPSPEGEENRGGRLGTIDRRQYLKLGATAAAGAVGTVGFSGTSTAQSRGGVSFDRVVDAVDDLGMDPNGNSAIDSALDRGFGDGTLVEFPPGEYLVTRPHQFPNVSNVGIVGATGDRSDVEFVFPDGYDGRFLNVRFGQNWLFGDFTVQQTGDRSTGVGMAFGPDRDATIRNVEIAGFNPRDKQRGMEMIVYDSDGEATIDGYVRTGGSAVGDYPSGTQALLVPSDHEGTLYIKDPQIENAGENGIYASRCSGDVRIEGGYFANNDIASVRIAGDGSYVKNSTFVVDTNGADKSGSFDNARALWFESGSKGYLGGLVENCEFTIENARNSDGAIRIQPTAGEVTIRDCRIRNETRFPSIYAEEPARVSGSAPITVENCSITGGSSNPRRGAIELEERDGSRVSACCISMDGEQDGVVVRNASGCTVRRSTIDVNGRTLATPGSDVGTSGISESGSCPLPTDGGSGAGGNTGSSDDAGSSDDDDSSDSSGDDESASDDGEESNDGESSSEDGGSGGSSGGTRTLRLTADTVSPYEFTVSGDLSFDASYGTEDNLSGSSASGVLVGGTDSYEFTGDITSFSIEGSPTVTLDGRTVDPASLGGGTSGGSGGSEDDSGSDDTDSDTESSADDGNDSEDSEDSDDGGRGGSSGEMRALRLSGSDVSPYEFTVSGDVSFDPAYGTEDRIEGSTVSGVLAGGSDSYQFTGDITSFTVEGSPTVRLDGRTVDPASLGSGSSGGSDSSDGSSGDDTGSETESSADGESESTDDDGSSAGGDGDSGVAKVLLLRSDDASPYEVEVSGDIAFDPSYGTEDSVSDSSANGFLAGGGDAYRFTGSITRFDYEGDVRTWLDGESVDPAELAD